VLCAFTQDQSEPPPTKVKTIVESAESDEMDETSDYDSLTGRTV